MKLHEQLCMHSFLSLLYVIHSNEERLLFSTHNNVKEINLETGVVRLIINKTGLVYSMAYDHKERQVFAPRYGGKDIIRFPYPQDQTVKFKIVKNTTRSPFGLAFDSMNRHIYWTEDQTDGKIMRCNTDGSNLVTIHTDINPTALTIDIQKRWLFYGQNIMNGQIYRLSFDGADIKVIIKNLNSHIYGIGVDVAVNRLYWMEYNTGNLKASSYNGSDVQTVVRTKVGDNAFGISVDSDLIFFPIKKEIVQLNKSLGRNATVRHTDTQDILSVLFYKSKGKY